MYCLVSSFIVSWYQLLQSKDTPPSWMMAMTWQQGALWLVRSRHCHGLSHQREGLHLNNNNSNNNKVICLFVYWLNKVLYRSIPRSKWYFLSRALGQRIRSLVEEWACAAATTVCCVNYLLGINIVDQIAAVFSLLIVYVQLFVNVTSRCTLIQQNCKWLGYVCLYLLSSNFT